MLAMSTPCTRSTIVTIPSGTPSMITVVPVTTTIPFANNPAVLPEGSLEGCNVPFVYIPRQGNGGIVFHN